MGIKAQHLVNVSGGKDSTAAYLLAIESGRPFRAVFADTGNEHEATYEYVAQLAARTGGPQIEVVRADFTQQLRRRQDHVRKHWPDELQEGRKGMWEWHSSKGAKTPRPTSEPPVPTNQNRSTKVRVDGGAWRWRVPHQPLTPEAAQQRIDEALALLVPTGNPYLDLCLFKGFFPGWSRQFCTEELKISPIVEQIVLPMLRSGPVLQWLGIRAEESRRRAKDPRYNRHESGSWLWRPILRWREEQVWEIHRRHGVPPNPLYQAGATRVGCWPCINCKKDEVRLIADLTPEHIERVARWERMVGDVSKSRSATFFPALTDPTDTDRPDRTYASIHDIVEWSRTGRGGRQFDLFFQQQAGGGCTSDLGLCET